jgi:hypothetical protein
MHGLTYEEIAALMVRRAVREIDRIWDLHARLDRPGGQSALTTPLRALLRYRRYRLRALLLLAAALGRRAGPHPRQDAARGGPAGP